MLILYLRCDEFRVKDVQAIQRTDTMESAVEHVHFLNDTTHCIRVSTPTIRVNVLKRDLTTFLQ